MATAGKPWYRHEWTGEWVSLNGCPAGEIFERDVAQYIVDSEEGDSWDGLGVCLVKLHDGRYAAWECFYGPTGSGFCCDAYGGNADVWFAHDPREFYGYFTDEARAIMSRAGYTLEPMPCAS